MGLDGVEIIMEVEKDFGIRISDIDAERLTRVEQMQSLLVDELILEPTKLRERLNRLVFLHLQTLLSEQMNVRRSKIKPETRFIEDLGV